MGRFKPSDKNNKILNKKIAEHNRIVEEREKIIEAKKEAELILMFGKVKEVSIENFIK